MQMFSRRELLLSGLLCLHLTMLAQLTRLSDGSYRFEPLLDRLSKVSEIIPQEKVYIHMDNTCYFQGDTIWFAAYLRQTSDNRPSQKSGVLYVELLNNDGYLVERKMIEMKEGRGNGFFSLNNQIQYSGFYELRAYTRWQLNWGLFEHKHSKVAGTWFESKEMEQNFYRDYEKLYSRVFPVYDRPAEPGGFDHNMTSRIMRRTFKKDMNEEERELTLKLFPEGGNLVAGVENRVAFEAVMSDGEWLTGKLTPPPSPSRGRGVDSIPALSRGRGMFTVVPEKGVEQEVTFTTEDGQMVKAKLPKPEEQGVALQVKQEGDSICIETRLAGVNADSLAMTIMHEGHVKALFMLNKSPEFHIHQSRLSCGVNQVTVFDVAGRVWADRLCFVTKAEEMQPTLAISGLQDEYHPYDSIGLDIQGNVGNTTISLSVRDGILQDELFDNAGIFTEMLLSSEIRGFVPDPGWFFEKDDSLHRAALDLLMMTQGWRRFNWRDMAVKGAWELSQPNERFAPIVMGKVYPNMKSLLEQQEEIESRYNESMRALLKSEIKQLSDVEEKEKKEELEARIKELYKKKDNKEILKEREMDKIKREVRVHAELTPGGTLVQPVVGEAETRERRFRIQLPSFYGKTIFFIAASDTTKWKNGKKYTWTQMAPGNDELVGKARKSLWVDEAEFTVRVHWPYPRFVKPYNFYQQHLAESRDTSDMQGNTLSDGTKVLREVAVRARRNGLWRFNDSQPAVMMDYEVAKNIEIDAGVTIVRALCSDYGLEYPFVSTNMDAAFATNEFSDIVYSNKRYSDRIYTVYGPTPLQRLQEPFCNIPLDSIYDPKYLKASGLKSQRGHSSESYDRTLIYTDYCPRLEGSKRYKGSNLPETRVALYPFYDGSLRAEYRDRRYILDGFAQPAEFYNPDYSKQKPQEPTDYRRTLYWNPSLPLDAEGRARVTLYNNSRTTQIEVDAAGQASDGTLLWK